MVSYPSTLYSDSTQHALVPQNPHLGDADNVGKVIGDVTLTALVPPTRVVTDFAPVAVGCGGWG